LFFLCPFLIPFDFFLFPPAFATFPPAFRSKNTINRLAIAPFGHFSAPVLFVTLTNRLHNPIEHRWNIAKAYCKPLATHVKPIADDKNAPPAHGRRGISQFNG